MTSALPHADSQRVLIFGGTFDPPHRAHVELPQAAARELKCDRIIYVPAAISPLKAEPNAAPPTPAHHRLAMLRLALQGVANAEISTVELDRPPPSYTIDTLRALAATGDGHATIVLLIGADQALDFHRWKAWREILRLATPAVMLRPPWTPGAFADELRKRYDAAEVMMWEQRTLPSLPTMDISATEIRRRLREESSLESSLDPRVERYIQDHGLYTGSGG